MGVWVGGLVCICVGVYVCVWVVLGTFVRVWVLCVWVFVWVHVWVCFFMDVGIYVCSECGLVGVGLYVLCISWGEGGR